MNNKNDRHALAVAALSFFCWGIFPIYWKLLKDISSLEIVAHRIIWSLVFYYFIFRSTSSFSTLRKLSKQDWMLMLLAGLLITANWCVFIYAVNSGRILEGSLAYFLNPLMNVAVGVFFFREPFPTLLKIAILFATTGVLVYSTQSSGFPWLSLWLASTFCLYGIVKKKLKTPAATSSLLETFWVFFPALFSAMWLRGNSTTDLHPHHLLLFMGSGIITGLPLFLFSWAAQRVHYSTIGLLQFIGPSLQFLIGWIVYHENVSPRAWVGFSLIWVGVLLYCIGQLRKHWAQ